MRSRTWGLLGGAAAMLVVISLAAVAMAGGDDEKAQPRAEPTTTTSSTTTSTTLAALTTTTVSTQVTTGIICTTPEEAAKSFVEGWLAGDRAAAERCASTAAADELFQTTGAGAQYTWQGCFGDPGMPTCSYTYEGGAVNLTANGTEAAGWKVVDVGYVAD
jgi:hypothetical protein